MLLAIGQIFAYHRSMEIFISGLDLCRRFFQEAVRPLLAHTFPAMRYTAALLGPGSEVLGLDTEMSTDHDWGPRLFVFLREEDAEQRDDMIGSRQTRSVL